MFCILEQRSENISREWHIWWWEPSSASSPNSWGNYTSVLKGKAGQYITALATIHPFSFLHYFLYKSGSINTSSVTSIGSLSGDFKRRVGRKNHSFHSKESWSSNQFASSYIAHSSQVTYLVEWPGHLSETSEIPVTISFSCCSCGTCSFTIKNKKPGNLPLLLKFFP